MIRYLGAIVLMAVLSTGARAATSSALPEPVVPDCLGVNIHFTGTEREQVNKIAEEGFRFIRMDFTWSAIEKEKGKYDFKAYDELVDSLATKGIRAYFILDYSNRFYDNDLSVHTDEGRAAFAEFAAAGASHFKGKGVLWEIYNEPNIGFWRPQPNVEDYVKLAKAVYPALKKADPNCTVLAPALSGWDLGFLESAFKNGLLEATDVVSLHPYGASKPEDATILYGKVRSLISQYAPKGKQYPIVSGEWGYSSYNKGVPVETQADYVARQFLSNMMNGCRISIWYDWHDDGPDPNENEHRFGTVAQDFTPKPAFYAVRTLTTELRGYSFSSRIRVGSDDDYLALFKKHGDYRLAAWTTGEPHSVTLPMDAKSVDIVSRSGDRTKVEVKDGKIELKLTGSPQYVWPTAGSLRWAVEAGWNVSATAVPSNEGLKLDIKSTLDDVLASGATVGVSGHGIREASVEAKANGPEVPEYRRGAQAKNNIVTVYEHSGDSRATATVTLKLAGMSEPIVRVVEVDTSACPRVEVLPPAGKAIPISIYRPRKGSDKAFKGKLVLGNPEHVRFVDNSVPFELPAGVERVTVYAKLATTVSDFAFACNLVDEKGYTIIRMPAKRYVLVESFAGGKPGKNVLKYGVTTDGDAKVACDASLTYAKAPQGGPEDVCAKLDYKFGAGWKFINIVQDAAIPIEGKPRAMKIWVKGDGGHGTARMRIKDAGKETFQPDFGAVNFTDWRCMEADLTGTNCGHWGGKNTGKIQYPIKWDTMLVFDNVGGADSKGTVYIGPAMLCYD